MLQLHIPHSIWVVQAYQKALLADPNYKPASENLAVVLTDLGTSLKLTGNVQDGLAKYYEALKADSQYAVRFTWVSF